LLAPPFNKAVFLDRDGVINRERGEYTYLLEDFKWNDGVEEALKIFQDKNYLLIIISNQSGIQKEEKTCARY
jgi:D-glycero-D-manno-heptose 1,7-bisphosphate phosphatase